MKLKATINLQIDVRKPSVDLYFKKGREEIHPGVQAVVDLDEKERQKKVVLDGIDFVVGEFKKSLIKLYEEEVGRKG